MKKLTLITLLCFSFYLGAHAQVSSAYKTQVESIFQVNRSHVTTGLLQDYGIFYTNVEKFNGVRSDTSYLEFTEWQSVFNSLYTYRFNSTANIPEPATVFAQIATTASQNTSSILITGLHYRYERFKSNAVSGNLVYISNNKIYDRAGRPTTPYEVKQAFAMVPYRSSLKGSFHQFMFKPELFYTNTGKTISNVKADFNDGGGYRTLTNNVAQPITYTSDGEKKLIFKITYTDGTSMESHTKIEVTGAAQYTQARYVGANTQELQFPLVGFAPPKAYQSTIGRALVTVEYTNQDRIIRKPLIVVEGFDAWRIINPDNPERNFSFNDAITSIDAGGLRARIDMDFSGQTLSDALESNDYDLIFIDFENGTDHIQRNAFLVANVIQWVNSVKQPYNSVPQKNVVIGFSMGGLVARYALRDMEMSGINHDTRLNVSFDSPHQGANVPVAFQAAVLHLAGSGIAVGLPGITYMPDSFTFGRIVPELGRARDLLNTPAARQMLRYQVTGGGDLLLYDNSQHTAFLNEYRQLGYPSQNGIRNLVIANGSECGTDQGFAPNTSFVNVNEKYKLPWWGNLLGNILSPLTVFTNYSQAALGAGLTTRTDIKYEFKVNALPNQSVQEIYKFKLSIRKKILFLINIDLILINKSFSSTASLLPLDNAGGGIYDIGRLATLPVTPSLTRFSFVPTFSALDIGGGSQTITASDLAQAYSPAKPPTSPKHVIAANFTTNPTESNRTNEVHTQITLRNGRWLFNEIQGTPAYFSCSYACSSLRGTISGPSLVCPSNSTFTFSGLPPGVTITWTQSGSLAYVAGQGTTSYTVKATGTGFGSLTATLSGECGAAAPIFKTINISDGTQPTILDTYVDCYEQVFETNYADGASVYNWSINDLTTGNTTMYTNKPYKLKTALPGGNYRVNVGSGCAGSAAVSGNFQVDCAESHFTISPNPSNDVLVISNGAETEAADSSTSQRTSNRSFTVSLFDDSGNVAIAPIESLYGEAIKLDVKSIRKGHYIIHIQQGKELSAHHVLIE